MQLRRPMVVRLWVGSKLPAIFSSEGRSKKIFSSEGYGSTEPVLFLYYLYKNLVKKMS